MAALSFWQRKIRTISAKLLHLISLHIYREFNSGVDALSKQALFLLEGKLHFRKFWLGGVRFVRKRSLISTNKWLPLLLTTKINKKHSWSNICQAKINIVYNLIKPNGRASSISIEWYYLVKPYIFATATPFSLMSRALNLMTCIPQLHIVLLCCCSLIIKLIWDLGFQEPRIGKYPELPCNLQNSRVPKMKGETQKGHL